MCRLQQTSYKRLHDKHSRALAKLALIARNDCVYGGARASVLADRLGGEFGDVVSEAYTSSTGEAREYLPFECPECGSACLGESAALNCCADSGDDWSEELGGDGDE